MKRLCITLLFVTSCARQHTEPTIAGKNADSASSKITSRSQIACPEDMREISGDYCPNVEQICLQWVDSDNKPMTMPPGSDGRCGTFKSPSRCLSEKKVHRRYCIDTFEYPNKRGVKPQSWMTWYDAKNACEQQGKRLCTRPEWTFACEGPMMQPYPYGDGYHRDKTACNFDNHVPKGTDVFDAKQKNDPAATVLDSLLVPAGSNPRCVSPFGVYDMVGNIDEWVVNESGKPYRSSLMSGHVFGVRNRCRPSTDAHNEGFYWYETGARCCADL